MALGGQDRDRPGGESSRNEGTRARGSPVRAATATGARESVTRFFLRGRYLYLLDSIVGKLIGHIAFSFPP